MRRSESVRSAVAILFAAPFVGLGACGGSTQAAAPGSTEILWDEHGVPHVFAASEEELFRGFGWAQMRAHGELLLQLVGQSRGRAAELWGETFLASDRWVLTRGIPERAREWYAAQTPEFRRNLDAFAAGANAFAREHPGELGATYRQALPIDGVDLLSHQQRVLAFTFLGDGSESSRKGPGSYGWAIAPQRSASGNALLLANPHLPWTDLYLLFEAHLSAPGIDAYGASLVGFPVLGIAFNERLGWTHTFNTLDGVDLYDVTPADGGYLWEGAARPFDEERRVIRVRRGEDEFDEVEHVVRSTVHGPVLATEGGGEVALRVAGLDRARALEQWWRMGRATDLAGFEDALRMQQLPLFSVIYADRDGNALHVFGGHSPARPDDASIDWTAPVAGDDAATLWTELRGYDELPRVLNPPTGWLQNANDPPWTTTLPAVLDPGDFPADVAPRFMHFQAQGSARMLLADDSITFDELVEYKHSTRVDLADRLVDELVDAARASSSDDAERAADVLDVWDRHVDARSRGAVLFLVFLQQFERLDEVFAEPWDEADPLETPRGLADPARAADALARAARTVERRFDRLDVAWGELFRLRGGDVDEPCSGGMRELGIFRAFDFTPDRDGRMRAGGGDSYVALVEFADPVRAEVATVYGNSSKGGVPDGDEALERAAQGELRPALLRRAEIEAHLDFREWIPKPSEGTGQ